MDISAGIAFGVVDVSLSGVVSGGGEEDASDLDVVFGSGVVDNTVVAGAVRLGVVDPSDFGDEADDISSLGVVLSSAEVVDFSVFGIVLVEGVVGSSVMVVKAVLSAIEPKIAIHNNNY